MICCVPAVTLTNDQSILRIMRSTIAPNVLVAMNPAALMSEIDNQDSIDAIIIGAAAIFDPYT